VCLFDSIVYTVKFLILGIRFNPIGAGIRTPSNGGPDAPECRKGAGAMRDNHRVMFAAAAAAVGVVLAVGVALAPAAGASTSHSFIGGFKTITTVA
jgi:hypothetical protein